MAKRGTRERVYFKVADAANAIINRGIPAELKELRDSLLTHIEYKTGIRVVRETDEQIRKSAEQAKGGKFSVDLSRRNEWDNWRLVNTDEYAALASQVKTWGDKKRKFDVFYSKDARAVYLIRRDSSEAGRFDIVDVMSIDLPQNEIDTRRERFLQDLDDSQKKGDSWVVGAYRNVFRNDIPATASSKDRERNENARRLDGDSMGENRDDAELQSNNGEDGVYKDGALFAYRVGGSLAEKGDELLRKNIESSKPEKLPKNVSILEYLRNNGIHFKVVEAKHGSPHRFAEEADAPFGRFRDDKMGTGEGNQAFGWGHYLTNRTGIARGYAETLAKNLAEKTAPRVLVKRPNPARVKEAEENLDRLKKELQKLVSPKERIESLENEERRLLDLLGETYKEVERAKKALSELESSLLRRVFNRSSIAKQKRVLEDALNRIDDYKIRQDKTSKLIAENYSDEAQRAYKQEYSRLSSEIRVATMVLRQELKGRKEYVYEKIDRHLYTAEFDDAGLLDWRKPLTAEQQLRIAEQLREEGLEEEADALADDAKHGTLYTAKELHENDGVLGLNSPQERSKLLHRAGFVGHKFPAQSMGAGDYSKGTNYVIYDESALNIVDRVSWLQRDGVVYGYFDPVRKELHLNEDFADFDTPIHEWTHVWWSWVSEQDSRLTDKIVDLVKRTEAFAKLKAEAAADAESVYHGLDDAALAQEVFSRFVGKRGEEFITKSEKSLWAKLKEYAQAFFKTVLRTLGLSDAQVESLTLEDVQNMALRDLFSDEVSLSIEDAKKWQTVDKYRTLFKAVNDHAMNINEAAAKWKSRMAELVSAQELFNKSWDEAQRTYAFELANLRRLRGIASRRAAARMEAQTRVRRRSLIFKL